MSMDEEYQQALWDRWHRRDQRNHVREEWEVTGEPFHGYPTYRFVFGSPGEGRYGEQDSTPEQRAREFVAGIKKHGPWVRGPHLRHRLLIESEWAGEA